MRITFRSGIFVAVSKLDERAILREAGWRYHKGLAECPAGPLTCAACRAKLGKGWWTFRKECAARLYDYGDEPAKVQLRGHMRAVEASRATTSAIEIPHPAGLEYLPHQKAGIAYIGPRYATYLGDQMGLGKTIILLGVVNNDQTIRSVLIGCTATLRINWIREAQKWLVQDGRQWRFQIVSEDAPLDPEANFVIASYNRITVGYKKCDGECGGEHRKEIPCPACGGTGDGPEKKVVCSACNGKKYAYCSKCRGRGKLAAYNLKIIGSLMERKFDLVAFDEAHFLKNPRAGRTRAIIGQPSAQKLGLASRGRKLVFMSGSPIPNKPAEMWPVLSVCAPKVFGSWQVFARRYCDAHEEIVHARKDVRPEDRGKGGKPKTILKADGASNLAEFQELVRATCMIRRLKIDVLKDLPPKRRMVIPITPTAAARKLLAEEKALWEEKYGTDIALASMALQVAREKKALESAGDEPEEDDAYEHAVKRLNYLQKVAFIEMSKVRHEIALAKVPSVIEHMRNMFEEGADKIVCFGHHQDVLESIYSRFSTSAVILYGPTAEKKRMEAIDRFQKERSVKLFVAGIQAAGVGITLTASSLSVFAELDWVPGVVSQAEDRLHRIGQKRSVIIQHLVLDGSLDARMAHILIEKQAIADKALDRRTKVKVEDHMLIAEPEAPPEPVPRWMKGLLKKAMITLAERRDPATERSHGFSSFDSLIGQKLATLKWDYSDRQSALALVLARKYRRQLPEELSRQVGVYEAPTPAAARKARFFKGSPPLQPLSVIDSLVGTTK
jgi:SWI/SNF-related matrix-associated actin-dependent regulator 1 of chromatin subfamily A